MKARIVEIVCSAIGLALGCLLFGALWLPTITTAPCDLYQMDTAGAWTCMADLA